MEGQQNPTLRKNDSSVAQNDVGKEFALTTAHEQYIAFVALGGLIPDDTKVSGMRKMTTVELAAELDVDRTTLYNWRKIIPNFWDLVNEKRKELGSRDRLSTVWNGVFMKASTGDPKAASIYLANHDPDFRMPTEKREVEIGDGLAEALSIARNRQRQQSQPPIEGEIVSAPELTEPK